MLLTFGIFGMSTSHYQCCQWTEISTTNQKQILGISTLWSLISKTSVGLISSQADPQQSLIIYNLLWMVCINEFKIYVFDIGSYLLSLAIKYFSDDSRCTKYYRFFINTTYMVSPVSTRNCSNLLVMVPSEPIIMSITFVRIFQIIFTINCAI